MGRKVGSAQLVNLAIEQVLEMRLRRTLKFLNPGVKLDMRDRPAKHQIINARTGERALKKVSKKY